MRYIDIDIHTGSVSQISMLLRKSLCRLQFVACERSTTNIYQTRLKRQEVQVSNAIIARFTVETVSIYSPDLTVLTNNAMKPLLAGPI